MNFLELPFEVHVQILVYLTFNNFKLLACTCKQLFHITKGIGTEDHGDIVKRLYSEKIPSLYYCFKEEKMNWRTFYFRINNFMMGTAQIIGRWNSQIAVFMSRIDRMEIRILEERLKFTVRTNKLLEITQNGCPQPIHYDFDFHIHELAPGVLKWFCEKGVLPSKGAVKLLCDRNQYEKIAICCDYGILPGISAVNSLIANCHIDVLNYLTSRSPKVILEEASICYAYHTREIKIIDWIIKKYNLPNKETLIAIINDGNIFVLNYLVKVHSVSTFDQELVDFAFYNGYYTIVQWFGDRQLYPSDASIKRAVQYGLTEMIKLLHTYQPNSLTLEHLHISIVYNNKKIFYWLCENAKSIQITNATFDLIEKHNRRDLTKYLRNQLV